LKKPGLRYLYSCSYTEMGCPVIEFSSFEGTQWSRSPPPPPPPDDRNRSSFRNVVSSTFWNTGWWTKSQNPVVLRVIHHRQNPLGSVWRVSCPMQSVQRGTNNWCSFSQQDGGEVVSLTLQPPFTHRKMPGTHFC
jgi:hypothetical protein